MKAMDASWKWVNSHQQMADGLTKPAARDGFAEVLARGTHQLKFDPTFTAKKVQKEQKEEQQGEQGQLHEASEQVFGVDLVHEKAKMQCRSFHLHIVASPYKCTESQFVQLATVMYGEILVTVTENTNFISFAFSSWYFQ